MDGIINIELGGKNRGFRFKTKALGDIQEHFKVSISDFGHLIDTNTFNFYPAAFYYGLLSYSQKNKEDIDYTIEDVYDWIDEEPKGLLGVKLQPVVNCFLESIGFRLAPDPNETEDEAEATESKKK